MPYVGDPIPNYYVQTGFGDYPGHRGADFPAPSGTPILASHDGVVRMAGWYSGAYWGGGNLVYLTAHDGSYETSYQHMVSQPLVGVGQHVAKGQVIGYVGSTGNSTGPHLHFELWNGGRAWMGGTAVDPIPWIVVEKPLAPNERRVRSDVATVTRRAEPTSKSADLGNPLKAGDVGQFVAWKYGEDPYGEGNNIWFQGISGNWFYSGAFEDTGTHDLTDLNPVTPPPTEPGANQRVTISRSVNVRSQPRPDASLVRTIPGGTLTTPDGWITGVAVSGNTIWYSFGDGYSTAEGFEVSDTSGLTDLNPVTPPAPEPAPEPGSHTPDVKTPTVADFPKWIRYEEKLDQEVTPTWNAELFDYYDVEYNPVESNIHWWATPGSGGTHDSNVSWLLSQSNLNANYVVSDGRVTLLVPLNQNALTTGRRNPYGWKTENDPLLSEQGYKTLGFLHYLVEKLNPSLQGEQIRLHKEFMQTSCSELLPEKVREYAEKFKNGILDVATGEPVVTPEPPTPTPTPVPDYSELVKALNANTEAVNANTKLLKTIYRIGE